MKKYFLLAIITLAFVLRFYKLGSVPVSLYWDEASLGYNAYSILKSGKDEHGVRFPITNFAAFGDYKPPLYIYAAVPPVAVFGLNEFAVRFPSAFFGTLTVLLTYFIAKKLFDDQKIALISSLFLAVSPWHISLSRGAFEGNLALFFSSLGIFFFLKFAQNRPYYIFPSAVSYVFAMYTFTGQRLFVPFILLVLAIQFRKQVIANIKYVIAASFAAAILFWPLFAFATQTQEGRLRFEEVTIFKDLEPIDRSTRYREADNFSAISSIIHNRRLLYAREYMVHYFDAFNPTFLFTKGDANPRFSTQEVGQLYFLDLLLIALGIYYLFAANHKYKFLILAWLLVSPLGPAVARETPHALRMIHILPTFQLIAAYGFIQFFKSHKFKKVFAAFVFLLLAFNVLFYLHIYYFHWAKNYATQWQYGYKQAVEAIKPLYNDADRIVVSKQLGRPYIYFLLYLKYDPQHYFESADIVRDRFYFIDVLGFDKFIFTDGGKLNIAGNIIYVMTEGSTPAGAEVLQNVRDPQGKVVFEISRQNIPK